MYVGYRFIMWHSNAAAVVHFNFSTPELVISEGGDLPSQLSIVKTGQHQGNITVDIALTSTIPNVGGMCVMGVYRYCITTSS